MLGSVVLQHATDTLLYLAIGDFQMKRFKEFDINEDFTAAAVKDMEIDRLANLYRTIRFGTGQMSKDAKMQKVADLLGSELGKRARAGDDTAKKALNNRLGKNVDKYGQSLIKSGGKRKSNRGIFDRMATALIKRAAKERKG